MFLIPSGARKPPRSGGLLRALLLGALALGGCAGNDKAPAPPEAAPPAAAPVEAPRPVPPLPTAPGAFSVRLQYIQTTDPRELVTDRETAVTAPGMGLKRLPAGRWRVAATQIAPPQFTYPVYVKAYEHNETADLQSAIQLWKSKGYSPTVTTLGRIIDGSDGKKHDNRLYWLAVKHFSTKNEAESLKTRLHREKTWAWVREEVTRPARATVTVSSTLGQPVIQGEAPMVFRTEGTFSLPEARRGQAPVTVSGPIDVSIDQTGHMAICGSLPLEEYLRGILPAEMYPSWPLEALKAQAVAARSEILVHARGKHYFDGYDFCIEQHCRAFAGRAGHMPSTDRAVKETEGTVIVNPDGSLVPTVFSANCGGHSESNENVWDGKPDAALRARPDNAEGQSLAAPGDFDRWLTQGPRGYCSGDTTNYRWTRSIPVARLSTQLHETHGIGKLKAIEVLERGAGGRVKSLQVVGDRKSAVLSKELVIRRAFENLPSALCRFSIQGGQVVIEGAGFGHGVGLCQHGAHGMARQNLGYDAILRHYFSGVSLARL